MPHPFFNMAGVQNALARDGAAAQVINAGPNGPQGILLTEQIAWATPTVAPTAVVAGAPTRSTLATPTAVPTIVIKRSVNIEDLEHVGMVEDGEQGFDPEDPNVEIIESVDETQPESGRPAPPVTTKVAGAFGPGGVPAHESDFNFNKGPVAPDGRHRKEDMKEMKKAKKPKAKDTYKSLQQERKAYLAKLAAAEEEARAKAQGAN